MNDFWWPGGWGPQGRSPTGGGGLARVPNLRVCGTPNRVGWHMQGGKDELTSCRGTGRQSSPTLEVRLGEQARLVKTDKIQVRWAAAQPGQDRRLPSVATHSRLWRASDLGWGSSSKTAPGSLSTGSPAGRTPPHGDGSRYSQANVRVESVLRPPPERCRP